MELQRMFVTLALKADEFNQGLDSARKQASGFASSFGSNFQKAGIVATGALIGVGAAAVGGFGLAMKSAISMNASLEQSTMQFTTLMGDADMAAEHVAMLFELGAKTPFETEPIIAASKHLQVFGGAALNTRENLVMIGDAAAAVGQPFDEVAFWVGRAYSAIQGGQPFGEAAMRLQEMGLMTPEVRAQMEGLQQSGADASAVWGAFEGQLGTFTGAMEMQATSWAGITSTLSDSLQMLAANALAPFFDLAKRGVETFTNLLNSPEVQAGITALAEKLTGIIQAISDFVTGLTSGRDAATVFAELAFRLAEAFGATRQEAVQVYTTVKDFVASVIEIVSPITDAVLQFVSWKDVLIALGLAIASFVIPAIIGIVTAIAPILLTVAAVIAVVALLRNAWENNWGGIQEKTQAVINFIKPLIENALAAIKAWWAENGEAILAKARADLEALKAAFERAIEFIKSAVNNFLTNIKAWWEQHGEAIVATAKKAWELIQGLVDGVVKHIQLVIEAFRLAFEGDWEGFGAKIFEIWENAWNTVTDFLSGLWDMIGPWLASMWESIKTWFTTTDWKQLGLDIINGIVNGLISAGQAIIDTIIGFVTAAWDAVKAFFGIASPSKLMFYAGEMIAQGLIDGIRSRQLELTEAIDEMLGHAGTMGGIGGGFAGIFDDRVIGPLEDRLDYVTGRIEATTAGIDENLAALGMTQATPGLFYMLQRFSTMGSSHQQAAALIALDLMKQRNSYLSEQSDLQSELLYQQQRMAELEQQRANLNFLQQQYEMLKLIRHAGLDPSILSGVTLGLGADPGQLMDIMVRAMTEMVVTAGRELETLNAPTPGFETAGSTLNVQTQNINGGQHIYIYDVDESELELLGVWGR